MGAMDKLINFMRVDPDQDMDDDEDFAPEMDDEDTPRNRRRSSGSDRRSSRYQDDDDEDEEEVSKPTRTVFRGSSTSARSQSARVSAALKSNPLVDPGQEVRVFKPTNLDEARRVTDTLLNKQSAVLNLEGLDLLMAQRIIDFVGGSNYALHGHFTRISNFIFLFTPSDVDIAGDITENADGGSAMPSEPMQNMNGLQFGQN